MEQITEEQANAIYDMLMEECGATEYWREDFVSSEVEGCREFRFQGDLGFGGKFRNNGNGVYVDCYREDVTPETKIMIKSANARLREMGYPHD